MAGVLHHTVPQFMLSGFKCRAEGKKVFVWMYCKGGKPKVINTRRLGAEKYFYGKELDQLITEQETEYVHLTQRLRKAEVGGLLTEQDLPRFVSHLSLRTRALRQLVEVPLKEVLRKFLLNLEKEEVLQRLFASQVKRVRESQVTRGINPRVVDSVLGQLPPQFFTDLVSRMRERVGAMRPAMNTGISKAIRNGHIEGMLRIASDDKRAAMYDRLNWFLLLVEKPLILADCVCVFKLVEGCFRPVHDYSDNLSAVYLPVGTWDSCRPEVDPDDVNEASAKCSNEFFVSSEQLSSGCPYPGQIGDWGEIVNDVEMEAISQQVIAEALASSS